MKRTLEEGTALVSKRVKAIQLADKNELVVGSNDPIPLEDHQLLSRALRYLQVPQIRRQAISAQRFH